MSAQNRLLVLCACLQEQAEADYRSRFPDHFAAFADLADSDDSLAPTADPHAQTATVSTAPHTTSQAQAASSHAQALLKGDFLHHIVQLHMRLYSATPPAGVTSSEDAWQAGFERAYDLGLSIAEAQNQQGVGRCSAEAAALGHLLKACLEHKKLWPTNVQSLQGRPPTAVEHVGRSLHAF